MKSIRTKFFCEKCLNGLFYLGAGLLVYYNFRGSKIMIGVLCSAMILFFVIKNVLVPHLKFEPEDEMTKNHEMKAQAATYNQICVLLMFGAIVCYCILLNKSIPFNIEFNWAYVLFLCGILQIVEYINFIWIEKNGDRFE